MPKTGFMLRVLGQALPPDIADELGECEFAFDKSSSEELLTHGSKYSAYYFTATTRYVSFYFRMGNWNDFKCFV